MFNKMTTFSLSSDDIEVLDNDMVKTASEFLFPEGHSYDPDFLYLKVRGISAGEYWGPNKNADYFPEKELIKTYKTFLNAHSFKNHENKRVENAIGDVIEAKWNDKMKHVDLIMRIDRKIASSIVRAFEKGFMTDVSMGCKIKHSICSICGNVAQTRAQYCEHILKEKHKVYPDGRRTYEINIEPNFHDISVVLNGADRTAKATGIHIIGDKVAFYGYDESIEKAASYEDNMSREEIRYTMEQALEKIASTEEESPNPFAEYSALVNKNQDGVAKMKKIAEIAKEIQGKITSILKAKDSEAEEEGLDEAAQKIKMFHTKYMDQEKCEELAEAIKDISIRHQVPIEQAFDDFIKLLNIAGIELSPLEFDRILKYTNDIKPDESDLDSIVDKVNPVHYSRIKDMSDKHVFDNMEGNNINPPTMFNLFRALSGRSMPNRNITMVIKRVLPIDRISRPSVDTPRAEEDMFSRIIRPMMGDRSNLRPFLMPRLIKVAMNKGETYDAKESLKHFISPVIDKVAEVSDETFNKYALSSYEYSAYQDSKCEHYLDEEKFAEINKYAYEIEKEASNYASLAREAAKSSRKGFDILGKGLTKRKALAVALPASALYSKYQRSKINSGERVSSPEFFAAQYPKETAGVAGAAAVLGAGAAMKAGKKLDLLRRIMKKTATDNHIIFDKYAKDIYTDSILDNCINIFKCSSIDNELKIGYNDNQIDVIKESTILKCMEREDLAEEKMANYNISDSDVNKYLLLAEKYLKIELDKKAKELESNVIGILKSADCSDSAIEKVLSSISYKDIDSILISKINAKEE